MKRLLTSNNPWTKASVWGTIGSVCMLIILSLPFETVWIKEMVMAACFALSLLTVLFTVKASSQQRAFSVTFFASLVTWMCMFALPHLILAFTSWQEYQFKIWIVMFPQMLTLGIIVCAPLAWLIVQIKKLNPARA